jgi:hypothetical protein
MLIWRMATVGIDMPLSASSSGQWHLLTSNGYFHMASLARAYVALQHAAAAAAPGWVNWVGWDDSDCFRLLATMGRLNCP